ncbi:hypothetical protein BDY21DRAFT_277982 [Lineolata rhizophorae]|uniref:AhpD-like protein n=1 Tax=Lineolata rhizophorae TaxID=578093 RepID=A0A6A6PCY4_9PEZI|nr:hypothetical protein BDY21DRAFT_277982 [Lineolata rhizophorae]
MEIPPDRTEQEAIDLFKAVEKHFPSESLGNEKWYLVVISTLTCGGMPEFAPTFYRYLIERPEFSTHEARRALMRRLREALVKCVGIIGVCRPLDAILRIDRVTAEEDKEYSCSRDEWNYDEAHAARGRAWLEKLYKGNLAAIEKQFESQKDFGWITTNISYGLYLSDHNILDGAETELVVLSGIVIQNLPSESHWHLRAMRRIGVSSKDVEKVHQCIDMIAAFARVRVDKPPRVADIEWDV